MTGPSAVSPTELAPEWDVTLTDGTDSVGFTLGGPGAGGFVKDPRRIQRTPIQRTALKTSQGGNKYDDLEWPYMTVPQDDWSGGRGMLNFDDDASRYYDGYRVDTTVAGKILRGPKEFYSSFRTSDSNSAGNGGVTWLQLIGTYYIAGSFVAGHTYSADVVEGWIKMVGNPGQLIAELRSASGSDPGTVLKTITITSSAFDTEIPYYHEFDFTGTQSVISGTIYWVCFRTGTGTHDTDNHWEIGLDYGAPGKYSTDGSTWNGPFGVNGPYFRVAEASVPMKGMFFDYKGAKYFVAIPDSGSDSWIYINGDRGAADANTGALTTLVDAKKSWTTNAWAGAKVILTAGPGSDEPQNWRTISSNTGTVLTVSPAWNVTHTTSTEYVITDADTWNYQEDVASPITDVAVAGDVVFFACGFDANTKVYREYRDTAGDWTISLYTGSVPRSEKLLSILQPDGTYKLFGTSREYNEDFDYPQAKRIWSSTVFTTSAASRVYKDYGEVFPTNVPWSNRVISNVTHDVNDGMSYIQVAAGFTTGTLAVYEPPDPVDLTNGEHLGFWIKPTVAFTAAGQLQLKLDDWQDLGSTYTPTKLYAPRSLLAKSVCQYDGTTLTDMPKAYDGIGIAHTLATWTTSQRVFVGFTNPVSAVYWNFGSGTVNGNTATMAVYYFNGSSFTEVVEVDHTLVSGDTLAQSGYMEFALPVDWEPSYVNSVEAYWMQFIPSADLTANMTIYDIYGVAKATFADNVSTAYDPDTVRGNTIVPTQYDGIYVGWSDKFNAVYFNLSATVNTVASSMTAYYFDGYDWSSLTISDGTKTGTAPNEVTLAQNGNITFTIPYDWETYTINGDDLYWIKFVPVPAVSTNMLGNVGINSVYVTRQNTVTIDLPALGDFDWTYVVITPTVGFNKYPYPDCTQIKSIALVSTSDKAAYNIRLHGGIHLLDDGEDIVGIEDEVRVNNIAPYGSSSGIGINPYILTDSGVYEIQQENDNAIVKLPIGEISAFASHDNGVAYCTNDVYLYFNLGRKIERYYNGNLEDIGPDLDAGLPATRQGDISALVSYPGRVYASIDAGSSGYSSILTRVGNGWHEIYRAPYGKRIPGMGYQPIPGSGTGKLWFVQGGDLVWVGVTPKPDDDDDYYQTGEGYLTTGWFYGGMQTIKKVFDSFTMMVDMVGTYNYCYVEYQTDNGLTWAKVSGNFDSALEEIALATVRPTGRRIRFRVHLIANSYVSTPEILAYSVDLYGVVPVKYQYTWTALLSEFNGYDVNLDGNEQIALGYNNAAETALAKLDAWTDAATVLTMNSRFSVYDSKTVLLTAPAHVPVDINSELQLERHVLSITCHDL